MLLRQVFRLGLSGKLLLLFSVTTVILLILIAITLKHIFRSHFEENVRPHMIQYLQYVRKDIGYPPNQQHAKELAKKLNIEIHLISKNSTWSSSSHKVESKDIKVDKSKYYNGVEYAQIKINKKYYMMMRYKAVTILYGISNLAQQRSTIKWVPLVILIIFFGVLYFMIRRLFYPIKTIQRGIKQFGEGDLDYRISLTRKDELGELADNVNSMIADIQQMLDAKRQLLLAISHELRTPLTRVNVALELMEDSKYRPQIKKDVDEMGRLIEEIIETERLSTHHNVLNKRVSDINSLVQEVKESYFESSGLNIEIPDIPVRFSFDNARVKLLLKNLIENAIDHSVESQTVPTILIEDNEKSVIIKVTDRGKGIDPKHIDLITEPFYRIDPSRQRKTGGYGLGLYLCCMIAKAHGGELKIKSGLNKGTVVSVELPK